MKNVYGGMLPLAIMEPKSFISKINYLAQDLLKALVVTTNCFMPFVKEKQRDRRYWTEQIFRGCYSRPKLQIFMADLVLLLGNSEAQFGDGSVQRDLIYNHQSALVTEVARRGEKIRFKEDMRAVIHEQLRETVGRRHLRREKKLKNSASNWAIVKNRILDTAIPVLERWYPSEGTVPSITYKRKIASVDNPEASKMARHASSSLVSRKTVPVRPTLGPIAHVTETAGMLVMTPKYRNETLGDMLKRLAIQGPILSVTCMNRNVSAEEQPPNRGEEVLMLQSNSDPNPKMPVPTELAHLSDFVDQNSRLCIYKPDTEVYLCMSVADYYLVNDLRHLPHSFENGTPMPNPLTSSRLLSIVPPMAEAITNDFTIVRAGGSSGYFEKHFKDLRVNFSEILSFVLHHGDVNPTRDGSSNNRRKMRIDFGCAGDGYEKLPDGISLRPYLTCGLGVFDKLDADKRDELKCYYADIMDRMQMIHDEIEVSELNNDRPYNFGPRSLEYGCALRNAIGASLCRMEWMTTQVKKVSVGERTDEHKDERNCDWKGYTKTAGLCLMLKCKQSGVVYSLKFIANSRKRIGDYYGENMRLKPILARIRCHLERLDQAYALMYKKQICNRSKDPAMYARSDLAQPTQPTHLTFFNLVVDKWSPWIRTRVGRNTNTDEDVMADIISMPANIVRSYFLSPACTIIYRFKQYLLRTQPSDEVVEDKLIEVAVICGYQTSMIRPYIAAGECVPTLDSKHPSKALYQLLMNTFGSITGSFGCHRLNPTGVNFHNTYEVQKNVTVDDETFAYESNEMNGVMMVVVTYVKRLMDSLNELMASEEFHHDKVEEMIKNTCAIWKQMDVDIGEFRLMIIVQVRFMAFYISWNDCDRLRLSSVTIHFIALSDTHPLQGKECIQ